MYPCIITRKIFIEKKRKEKEVSLQTDTNSISIDTSSSDASIRNIDMYHPSLGFCISLELLDVFVPDKDHCVAYGVLYIIMFILQYNFARTTQYVAST